MDATENLQGPETLDAARAGLRCPTSVLLSPPLHLVRFASSDWAPDTLSAGSWWIREADFLRLERENRSGRLSEGLAWRFALAVPQSRGNRMDLLVVVALRQPIGAWSGSARPQRRAERAVNGASVSWMGSPNVPQLYIPGVAMTHAPWTLTPLGARTLQLISSRQIDSHQLPIASR